MRRVGPFQIVKRQNQFEVRQGRSILSRHSRFLDAEDFALRHWLGPQRKGQDEGFEGNELQRNVGTIDLSGYLR